MWASVVVAHRLSSCGSRALECRLSSCGTRALLLRDIWDLPGPGLESMSPALAGGFLTTEPQGRPDNFNCRKMHEVIAERGPQKYFSQLPLLYSGRAEA